MSKLGNVVRGRKKTPLRYVIYGPEGVGKSTLAAGAPNPIFLDVEQGTGLIDCARYPLSSDGPVTYDEVLAAIEDLRENQHDFETVVIDTISSLQSLIYDYVCKRDSKKGKRLSSIEDYGYGKGYQVAVDEWRALCAQLDSLRTRRNMNIILLGHADIRAFKNPEGPDYDRYCLRIHDKAAGLIMQWADAIGFYRFDEQVAEKLGKGNAMGVSSGRRFIEFLRSAAYDAKSRLDLLPDRVELQRSDPWGAIRLAANPTDDSLIELIWAEFEARSASLSDEAREELKKMVAGSIENSQGDTDALYKLLLWLKG